MIITRTPFRISFFGGGTDYPVWYRKNGGAVLSTTINKHCYISCRYLPPFFDYNYRVRYFKDELVQSINDIQHPSVRECLRFMNIQRGVEVVHNSDLPARSGLGSSSTFTVGMLHALCALKHYMPTKRELALNAIEVEQDWIKESVGSQDQTAAAFGSVNKIVFGGLQHIDVQPVFMSPERLSLLQESIMLFFTGFSRTADEISKKQIDNSPNKHHELSRMKSILDDAVKIIQNDQHPITDFGELLNEQWRLKKNMSELITNDKIDSIYERGRNAGAIGGKLLGAGAGGFFMFFVKPEMRHALISEFSDLLHVPFRFDHGGSQVIYYTHDN